MPKNYNTAARATSALHTFRGKAENLIFQKKMISNKWCVFFHTKSEYSITSGQS